MKLSELIAAVGDESVKIQPLDGCMIRAKYDHKKGTEITFGTEQALTPDRAEDFGMIVWIPRDKLKVALGN